MIQYDSDTNFKYLPKKVNHSGLINRCAHIATKEKVLFDRTQQTKLGQFMFLVLCTWDQKNQSDESLHAEPGFLACSNNLTHREDRFSGKTL